MSETPQTSRLIDSKEARRRAAASKPDQSLRDLLDNDDSEGMEALVMEKLESDDVDFDFFLALLGLLVKRDSIDTADFFLQLLLDMAGDTCGTAFVEFASALLVVWPSCRSARDHLAAVVRDACTDSPGTDALIAHFDVAGSPEPLKALEQVETWVAYDQGRGVYSPSFGVGRVQDINLGIGKIRVAFQDRPGKPESFRIGEAYKLLEVLGPDHFLLAKLDDLPSLQQLAREDPGELLRRLFASERRSLTATELKQILSGIVPASSWTTWWSKAKQDPRLTVGTGVRPQCTWADSAEQAGEAIEQQFLEATPEGKLALALKHAGRSSELSNSMIGTLAASIRKLLDSMPGLALETALAVDRLGGTPPLFDEIMARDDIVSLLDSVRDRNLRRRGLGLLRDRRDDWVDLYALLIRQESDNSSIALMYGALVDAPDAGPHERLLAQVLGAPDAAPHLYLWLCREMTSREELESRADWPFLKALMGTLGAPAMKVHQAALRKLFDPGGAVDLVVKRLGESEARELLSALDKGLGLEEYRRDSVRQYLMECLPQLREGKKQLLFTTEEALIAKQDEFQKLIGVDIPENTVAMQKAKEHGDLKENFEYHAARARQEMLSSRAKTLHDQLTDARAIEPATVDTSSIAIGTRVTLNATTGQGALELTILGLWDSDPTNNVVSYLAPAVSALLGAKVGDEVSYDGTAYTVADINVWCS